MKKLMGISGVVKATVKGNNKGELWSPDSCIGKQAFYYSMQHCVAI
jgi:hypothetical protein